MRWFRWLAVAAMFVIGFGAVFVSTAGLGDTQAATTEYLTQLARRTDVTKTSAATGTVTSAGSYALAFGADARLIDAAASATASDSEWTVAEVPVAVGDRVSEGDILALADTADMERQIRDVTAELDLARMRLDEAESALDDARTEAQRQLVDARSAVTTAELSLRNAKVQRNDAAAGNPLRQARIGVIAAEDQLRAAKRTRNDLQAQLRGDFPEQRIAVAEAEVAVTDLETQISDLDDSLALATITSPVDGLVSAVNIKAGFVAPSSNAIEIDSTTLEVVADVVESDISSLALGQTAMVSIDALDLDVPGTVTSIAATTDGGTANVVTFPVTVTLVDPDPSIKPGMSSDVEITVASAPSVVAVPVVALRGRQGNYAVSVVDAGGTAQTRQVDVGLVTETLAEIRSGVVEGESVVVGTNTDRAQTTDDTSGFGGPGGFGGIRGLQGGGFRPDRGDR